MLKDGGYAISYSHAYLRGVGGGDKGGGSILESPIYITCGGRSTAVGGSGISKLFGQMLWEYDLI